MEKNIVEVVMNFSNELEEIHSMMEETYEEA